MCIVPTIVTETTPPSPTCPAKALDPSQRQHLAIAALEGTRPISDLAAEHQVSLEFVYQQADKADQALRSAFDPEVPDNRVLFYLPVTKAWLRQLVLALVLICHCSYRGVIELFRDLFDSSISVGNVHNIVASAVPLAEQHDANQDLAEVRIAALDEIFQSGRPVLVGCDADSTFCFLLKPWRSVAMPIPGACVSWNWPIVASTPMPPSPTGARGSVLARRRPCPACLVVATSSTSCTRSGRCSATWRTAPTRSSPPAAELRDAVGPAWQTPGPEEAVAGPETPLRESGRGQSHRLGR